MTFSTRYWQKRKLLLIIHESSFLPNRHQSFPVWKSMKSLGRGRAPGDACPSLRDATVTHNPCDGLRPVTRFGGSTDQTRARRRSAVSDCRSNSISERTASIAFLIAAPSSRSFSDK